MYEYLPDFLISEPDRMVSLGRGAISVGGLWLAAGSVGQIASMASAVMRSIGQNKVVPPALADIYPSLPTWWVPESISGCLPAVFVVAVGVALVVMGRKLKRVYF